MRYYAEQSPRGFANEINTYTFSTRQLRDAWVAAHAADGDVNSASCGARAITRRQAEKNVRFKGDTATVSFNGALVSGDHLVASENTQSQQTA